NMQDSKIDVGTDMELNNAQRLQLPWSIKKVILWGISYMVIVIVVSWLFHLLIIHLNHFNQWDLKFRDLLHITETYPVLVLIFAFLAFLKWQCKKVNLSFRTIWGSIYHVTQVRYILFAFVLGAIKSLLWAGKIVNFGNPPQYSSAVIVYGQIIVGGLLGPFREELYFRGVLYRILRKRNDSIISTLISALIFSAFHVLGTDLTGLFFIFFSGVVTAFLAEHTNSLTASFIYHSIGNLVSVVVFQYREFFIL
ncbi:MAG: CPBP family intramembrane metalloprotease, partial [Gemmatimonadetes bacterium]|nr:CPBP family intramembrane metalloprotease [Gemmatimonadota bacterium]